MWWDQKKELLKENESDKDLGGFLDGIHFPLCARHFFKACAKGSCASGEVVETQRESRVAGGYPVVEKRKHAPMFVRCTLCAKVLRTACAELSTALMGGESDTEGVIEAQVAVPKPPPRRPGTSGRRP